MLLHALAAQVLCALHDALHHREEVDEINFAFGTLDSERTGSVTHKQLKVALRAMGFPVKKADVEELLRRHGEDHK